MSNCSISIVPIIENYPDSKQKASEILQWLTEMKAVKAQKTRCALGNEGYAIDEGAKKIVEFPEELPYSLAVCGLEIFTERRFFDSGEKKLDVVLCPSCKSDIKTHFTKSINEWLVQGSSLIKCPHCEEENPLFKYHCEPIWGFSNLGFKFWNWTDFTYPFIEEFEKRLACDVRVVYEHI